METVTRETLTIDGKTVIKNSDDERFVHIAGAENLNIEKKALTMSLVKYVNSNTILDVSDVYAKIFGKFMEFVNGMLMIRNADMIKYAGFMNENGNVFSLICKLEDGVEGLQRFLKKMGISFELFAREDSEGMNIFCKCGEKMVPLSALCSSGTRSLIFFYYWYKQNKKIKFMYLDEFDAFYHTELATAILELLIRSENMQIIVSTHNTDIISNELLRPDCYFILEDGEIEPFYKRTRKALREAHNLQKMYKAGAFNEKL